MRVTDEKSESLVLDGNANLAKQVADLEASINTVTTAEKSVRKAQDHHLAIEMDKLQQ